MSRFPMDDNQVACVDMASGEREAFLANKTNRRFVFPTADLPFHESNAVGRAKAFTVALALFFLSASGAIQPNGPILARSNRAHS